MMWKVTSVCQRLDNESKEEKKTGEVSGFVYLVL